MRVTEFETQTFHEYHVPANKVGQLKAEVLRLNKKAKKLNTPGDFLTIAVGSPYVKSEYETNPFTGAEERVTRVLCDVTISGQVPCVVNDGDDFEVLCILQRVKGTNPQRNLIISPKRDFFQGEAFSSVHFANNPINCDHCGQNRKRNYGMVIRHNGEVKVIGKTCRDDYFSKDTAQLLWGLWNIRHELDACFDESGCTFKGGDLDTLSYLCKVLHVLSDSAFVPMSQEGMGTPPTRILVDDTNWADVMGDYYPKALELLNWAKSREVKNEFDENLKTAALSLTASSLTKGLLCFLGVAKDREEQRALEKAKQAEQTKDSDFVGEIKQRLEFAVTLTTHRTTEGHYGTTNIWGMVDDSGNVLTWFASSGVDDFYNDRNEPLIGESIKIKGTVKDHTVFREKKQTILNRVAVI